VKLVLNQIMFSFFSLTLLGPKRERGGTAWSKVNGSSKKGKERTTTDVDTNMKGGKKCRQRELPKGSISSTFYVRIFRMNVRFGSFYYVCTTRKSCQNDDTVSAA